MLAHPAKLRRINTHLEPVRGSRYGAKMSSRDHHAALAQSQRQIIDSTNPCRTFDDGVEDRLHVRGRPTDNSKYLSRRRLMFQGLAQFCVALLQFLEQPQ